MNWLQIQSLSGYRAAGGFTEEADAQWLNQAEPVSDGERSWFIPGKRLRD